MIPYERNTGADMTEGTENRKRGRPGTYSSDAERARAWRQRQRELIAAAKTAEPVVVENVEVERIVEKRVPALAKSTKNAHVTPNASNLFPLLKERFAGYQGEENAKRFRTNAAKAATAAREILSSRSAEAPFRKSKKTPFARPPSSSSTSTGYSTTPKPARSGRQRKRKPNGKRSTRQRSRNWSR